MTVVTAIQYRPRMARCRADVADNLRTSERLLRKAADLGSNLIVFPELCMTGYSFMNRDEAQEVAELATDGITARFMKRAASDFQSYVVWGFVESRGGALFNSASIAGPDGLVLATNAKLNLWGNDFLWASPGVEPPAIVRTDFGALSAIVCRDVRDKIPTSVPRTASKEPPLFQGKKVDVVAMCVNWGKGGFPSTSWMDFVVENGCTAVIANRWGEERNGSFVQDFGQGGSAIVLPDWRVRTDGLRFGEDCVVSAIL